MNKHCLLLIISLFAAQFIFAQSPEDIIEAKKIDYLYLEHLTKLKIDSVRQARGTKPLLSDPYLYEAAKDHVEYLTKAKTLSHFQADNKRKNTPQDRAEFYGAEDYTVSENVLLIKLEETTTYNQAALKMMTGWVNSPRHYANLISNNWKATAVALEYDKVTKELRAVQKFAQINKQYAYLWDDKFFPYANSEKREIEPLHNVYDGPEQVKKYPYRLKLPPKKKPTYCDETRELTDQMDKVGAKPVGEDFLFTFKDGPLATKIFKKRKNGMVMEFIPFTTYECDGADYTDKPGRRNGASYLTGDVAKPKYKKRLLKGQKKANTFVTMMPPKPESIADTIFEYNVMVLKKRRMCSIIPSGGVCGELMQFDLNPQIEAKIGNQRYYPDFEPTVMTFKVFFEKNKFEYDYEEIRPMIDSLGGGEFQVLRARIEAYASVEGTREINERLFTKRAQGIISAFESVQDTIVELDLTTRENWKLFREQTKVDYPFFNKLDSVKIKEFLAKPANSSKYEPILAKQRYGFVQISTIPVVNDDNINDWAMKEYKAIMAAYEAEPNKEGFDKKEIERAAQIQRFFYMRYKNNKATEAEVNELKAGASPFCKVRYQNWVYDYNFNRKPDVRDHFTELKKVANCENAKIASYNLAAFMIKNWKEWPYDDQSKKLKELKGYIANIGKGTIDDAYWDQMKLYYHFKKSEDFLKRGGDNFDKIKGSINFIKTYYQKYNEGEDKTLAIAKHLIQFQQYEWAKEWLEPKALAEPLDVDIYTLWVKLHFSVGFIPDPMLRYQVLYDAEERLSKEDWCGLFVGDCNLSFQHFDYEPLRNFYCAKCGDFARSGANE